MIIQIIVLLSVLFCLGFRPHGGLVGGIQATDYLLPATRYLLQGTRKHGNKETRKQGNRNKETRKQVEADVSQPGRPLEGGWRICVLVYYMIM